LSSVFIWFAKFKQFWKSTIQLYNFRKKKKFIARACCVQDVHIYIYILTSHLKEDQESFFVLSLRRFLSILNRQKSNRIEISMIWFLRFRFDSIWSQKSKSNWSIRFETESLRDVDLRHEIRTIWCFTWKLIIAKRKSFKKKNASIFVEN
jgi:hypothetical protein